MAHGSWHSQHQLLLAMFVGQQMETNSRRAQGGHEKRMEKKKKKGNIAHEIADHSKEKSVNAEPSWWVTTGGGWGVLTNAERSEPL